MSSNEVGVSLDEFQFDFFIAHAGVDAKPAERLYELLISRSRVFVDSRCLLYGDDWDAEIARAHKRSYITVVLISSRTEAAYYLREEIAASIAMARQNKSRHRVVPVYLDVASATGPEIPYGLRLKHGLYVPASGLLDGVADSLLDLIRKLSERTAGKTPLGPLSVESTAPAIPGSTEMAKSRFLKAQYFCYISRSKVDELYEQFAANAPSPCVTDGPVGALSEIPYGRPDLIHAEAEAKQIYARKLRFILNSLDNVRPFEWKAHAQSIFLRFIGEFKVSNIDEEQLIATIVCKAGRKELHLDCSLTNFSHLTVQNGRTSFQSTNYTFFSRRLSVTFETIFLMVSIDGSKFYGSPLFLLLESSPLVSL